MKKISHFGRLTDRKLDSCDAISSNPVAVCHFDAGTSAPAVQLQTAVERYTAEVATLHLQERLIHMLNRAGTALLLLSFFPHGCLGKGSPSPVRLKYKATNKSPELLALYEGWFGEPNHISVGYSSHDSAVLQRQIQAAKSMGISAFVVDWYGDRDSFVDQSYALMQKTAEKEHFRVAMMYEETKLEDGATDEAIADLTMFHDTYLSSKAPGRQAYLTYQGHPLVFIFRGGGHTDWTKVRSVVNKWNPAPLLIDKAPPDKYAEVFDGFYPWINPGPEGWASDGSHWGNQYLTNFYQTMVTKYADKIIVGGAWAQFNDKKASWGLNRHMSARCGQTYQDTFNFWRKYIAADTPIPFMMIETWNDYEEGSEVEPGIPTCATSAPQRSTSAK